MLKNHAAVFSAKKIISAPELYKILQICKKATILLSKGYTSSTFCWKIVFFRRITTISQNCDFIRFFIMTNQVFSSLVQGWTSLIHHKKLYNSCIILFFLQFLFLSKKKFGIHCFKNSTLNSMQKFPIFYISCFPVEFLCKNRYFFDNLTGKKFKWRRAEKLFMRESRESRPVLRISLHFHSRWYVTSRHRNAKSMTIFTVGGP